MQIFWLQLLLTELHPGVKVPYRPHGNAAITYLQIEAFPSSKIR